MAKRFKVSFSLVYSWLKLYSGTGSVNPKPHAGGQVSKIKSDGEKFLQELIKEQPALSLEELSVEYSKQFQAVGSSTIDRTLKKLKITRKKPSLFDPRKNTPAKKKDKIMRKISPFLIPKTLFLLMKPELSEI